MPTVVGEIKRHFRDHLWALHVPRRVQDLRNQVRRTSFELARSSRGSGPAAGVAEIAARSGLSEREVRIGIEAMDCFGTLSTDAGVSASDDGGSPGDVLGTCDRGYDAVVDRVTLAPYLRRLPSATGPSPTCTSSGHAPDPDRRAARDLPGARVAAAGALLRRTAGGDRVSRGLTRAATRPGGPPQQAALRVPSDGSVQSGAPGSPGRIRPRQAPVAPSPRST